MAPPKNVPKWEKAIAIPGMLLFGTLTVVTQKLLFEQKSMGRDIYKKNPHKFSKPWFQTNSMFIGMFLALAVYEVMRCMGKTEEEDQQQSLATADAVDEVPKDKKHWKMYFYVAAPACCDLMATSLMNIGLLYIQASVWQMLRGSMVLFSSIFCAFILHRPHYPYMWWSVLFIIVALTIVGVAAVCGTGVGKAGVTQGQVIMAICLVVGSQLVQASQIVVEDWLMHDVNASPVLIVGLEGMWGTLFTMSIFLPITQNVGTIDDEGNGVHEDTWDTLLMIKNSPTLLIFVILYVLFILAYNVTGMFVTNITSAVVRTILEGLRTLCIWIFELIIYYSIKGKEIGNHHPGLGEEWNIWSWMQMAGFLLLFTGMLTYNKILRLPFFKYPDAPASSKIVEPLNPEPLVKDK